MLPAVRASPTDLLVEKHDVFDVDFGDNEMLELEDLDADAQAEQAHHEGHQHCHQESQQHAARLIALGVHFVRDHRASVEVAPDIDALFVFDVALIGLGVPVIDLEELLVNFPISCESEAPKEDIDRVEPEDQIRAQTQQRVQIETGISRVLVAVDDMLDQQIKHRISQEHAQPNQSDDIQPVNEESNEVEVKRDFGSEIVAQALQRKLG